MYGSKKKIKIFIGTRKISKDPRRIKFVTDFKNILDFDYLKAIRPGFQVFSFPQPSLHPIGLVRARLKVLRASFILRSGHEGTLSSIDHSIHADDKKSCCTFKYISFVAARLLAINH
jgi:hypothetical protein